MIGSGFNIDQEIPKWVGPPPVAPYEHFLRLSTFEATPIIWMESVTRACCLEPVTGGRAVYYPKEDSGAASVGL